MSGLSLGIRVSNLKSVALTVLELFAFNSRFKLVRLTVPLRAHRNTDRTTSNENIIFVHLAEITRNTFCAHLCRLLTKLFVNKDHC